jgi:hypothetical protein
MSKLDRNTGNPDNNKDNWTQVQTKRSTMTKEKLEEKMTTMIKLKVTIMIRVPSNAPADYSAAEVHIAMIRELGKQDPNMIVLDHKGNNHVNIHKSFGQDKHKEFFSASREISTQRNGTSQRGTPRTNRQQEL